MVIGPEWTLHQDIVDQLVHKWPAMVRLFRPPYPRGLQCIITGLRFADSGNDAILQPWDDLQVYAFPPIAVIRKVLVN